MCIWTFKNASICVELVEVHMLPNKTKSTATLVPLQKRRYQLLTTFSLSHFLTIYSQSDDCSKFPCSQMF